VLAPSKRNRGKTDLPAIELTRTSPTSQIERGRSNSSCINWDANRLPEHVRSW